MGSLHRYPHLSAQDNRVSYDKNTLVDEKRAVIFTQEFLVKYCAISDVGHLEGLYSPHTIGQGNETIDGEISTIFHFASPLSPEVFCVS